MCIWRLWHSVPNFGPVLTGVCVKRGRSHAMNAAWRVQLVSRIWRANACHPVIVDRLVGALLSKTFGEKYCKLSLHRKNETIEIYWQHFSDAIQTVIFAVCAYIGLLALLLYRGRTVSLDECQLPNNCSVYLRSFRLAGQSSPLAPTAISASGKALTMTTPIHGVSENSFCSMPITTIAYWHRPT